MSLDCLETSARGNAVLQFTLEEFKAGTRILEWDLQPDPVETAKRLCELSRDVMFLLGDPSQASAELVRHIVHLFRTAVGTMYACADSEALDVYTRNVTNRANSLKQECAPAVRSRRVER